MAIFYKGILFLAASAFLGEGVEFLINLILAKKLGKHGLGLYMCILPTIYLIVLLSSFQLPVSISKFDAEKEESLIEISFIMRLQLSIILTNILLSLAVIILPFIPVFNGYHPLYKMASYSVNSSSVIYLCYCGYFMGRHRMGKIAVANFLRKSVQLLLLFVLFRFFQFDSRTSVLIAIATFIGSEIAVFFFLIYTFIIRFQQIKGRHFLISDRKFVRKNLMAVSVPTTVLRLFSALTGAVQPFFIKAALFVGNG